MRSEDSKLLLGLAIGAAVGAAIGYLAGSDKGEQLMEDLKDVAGKMKEGFNSALEKAKETGTEALKAVKKNAE
ncbi:YtxH domain-containing protein [Parabacteroides sp. OttesenSCG-928-G07]|jgi:gas vesicle protein|nr:YtxH domain-containing protein [Parabacteroides sp. OttesenSCG-928-G07]